MGKLCCCEHENTHTYTHSHTHKHFASTRTTTHTCTLTRTFAYFVFMRRRYDALRGARVVRDVECTPVIPTLIHNEFKTLEYLKLWREGGVSSVRVPKRSKSVLK